MKKSITVFIFSLLSLIAYSQTSVQSLSVGNKDLLVTVNPLNGNVLEITKNNKPIVANEQNDNSLWVIHINDDSDAALKISSSQMSRFSSQRIDNNTLELQWNGTELAGLSRLSVTATIHVPTADSLSYWSLKMDGLDSHSIEKVMYPVIGGIVNSATSQMAIPTWMGHLYSNPHRELSNRVTKMAHYVYPGMFSMQFLSIYDKGENGFYAASNDANAYQKEFRVYLNPQKQLVSDQIHFPEYKKNIGSYEIPYQSVVGGFNGDWFTAAEIYRSWGTQQAWAKNSRLQNNQISDWLKNTSLWVWNRGRTAEVLKPVETLQKQFNLPISVLWHWWHNSSYDDTFPDYIPPRDGKEVFMRDVKQAKDKNINAIVYMNQMQWAKSTPSWTDENAEKFAAKNKDGSTTDHVYNIFSGRSLTNMCIATDFWRNKYTSLADTVINKYGVSGIYMDQACLSRMCYDTSHGHNLGGGNYWMRGSAKLSEQISERVNSDLLRKITLSGEGVSESWLPYLDAFLALQVSMERYAGIGAVPIPLFQAVYHPYGVVYGNYSSLLKPPYDEKWPAEQKPADALELLDPKYNMQFKMEQGRSFVWGMQPMISNYLPILDAEKKEEMEFLYQLVKVRNHAVKYLLNGEMMKNVELDVPQEKLSISKLSIYAGQKEKVTNFEKVYPTFYSGVWKSSDNNLGIALSNIGAETYDANLKVNLSEYGISTKKGTINLIDESGKKRVGRFKNGVVNQSIKVPSNKNYLIEIDPSR